MFYDILERAEEELNFYTDGYKLLIEAFSSTDEIIVFTITKFEPKVTKSDINKVYKKKKVNVRRKNTDFSKKHLVCTFNSLEEFCKFCEFIKNNLKFEATKLSKNISLFFYNNTYYLTINNVNSDYEFVNFFYSAVSEFGKLMSASEDFNNKLLEHGEMVVKKNAIDVGIKYFI